MKKPARKIQAGDKITDFYGTLHVASVDVMPHEVVIHLEEFPNSGGRSYGPNELVEIAE